MVLDMVVHGGGYSGGGGYNGDDSGVSGDDVYSCHRGSSKKAKLKAIKGPFKFFFVCTCVLNYLFYILTTLNTVSLSFHPTKRNNIKLSCKTDGIEKY